MVVYNEIIFFIIEILKEMTLFLLHFFLNFQVHLLQVK